MRSLAKKPLVAITMGDAAGIGPEITCKTLLEHDLYKMCRPIVFGDAGVIRDIVQRCDLDLRVNPVKNLDDSLFDYGTIDVFDFENIEILKREFGVISAMCGKAAVHYTQKACSMAMEGKIDAMVSAPLNKSSMRMAGYNYEGQTEIVGEMTGSDNYGMILLGKTNVLMYSNHMSLENACKQVTYEGVLRKIKLANQGLTLLNKPQGKIGISALNPHCGEGGIFGRQELDAIIPAVNEAKKQGIFISGPIPADIAFMPSITKEIDIMIAMYHDQANMAMKILGFGSIVTLLVGVSIIRTSTGHGTAFDIAGKNIADHKNLYLATKSAAKLAAGRMKKG